MAVSIGRKLELYTGLTKQTFINNINNEYVFYKDEGGKHNYIVFNEKHNLWNPIERDLYMNHYIT